MRELVTQASSILLGEVTNVASHQDEDSIYTVVTLAVEQSIKGEVGHEVEVRVPGGEVDGVGLWVEDAPVFQPGDTSPNRDN